MNFLDRWLKRFLKDEGPSGSSEKAAAKVDGEKPRQGDTPSESTQPEQRSLHTSDALIQSIRGHLTLGSQGRRYVEGAEFQDALIELDGLGRRKAADELLTDALLVTPSNALRRQLAERLTYRGEHERAELLLHDLRSDPKHAMFALKALGKRAEAIGDLNSARDYFEEILAEDISIEFAKKKVDALLHSSSAPRTAQKESREELIRLLGDRAAGTRYSVKEEIGRGGAAVVFRAHDQLLEREVAIKIYHRKGAASQRRARLVQEARIAAAFDHPHIVSILDIDEERDLLAMKYCSGGAFRQLMEAKRLSMREVGEYGSVLFRTLADIHNAGCLHLDIKPSNLLLDGNVLMIADFGTAGLKELGGVAGTRQYMAREQRLGEAVGPETDLYAAGLVLYEACTGRLPEGTSSGAPRPLLSGWTDGPLKRGLELFFSRVLHPECQKRIHDGNEAAQQFLEAVSLPEDNAQGEKLLTLLEGVAQKHGDQTLEKLSTHWVTQILGPSRLDPT